MDQQVFLSKKTLLKSRNWIGNITNIEIYESGDWIISFFDDATSMIMKCLEIFFPLYTRYEYLSMFFKNNIYLIRNEDYNLISVNNCELND